MPISQKPAGKTWFFRFSRGKKGFFKGGFHTAQQAREAETVFLNKVIAEETFPERTVNP